MTRMTSTRMKALVALCAMGCIAWTAPRAVLAQSEGGLYVAGYGFSFEEAAGRGLAQNPKGQRFFVLVLPPHTRALTQAATKTETVVRDRVTAAGGVLFVCQRDVDDRSVDLAKLVPGVVAVRGFPPPGSNAIAHGERYFPGENPDRLPSGNEALRRLRAACS